MKDSNTWALAVSCLFSYALASNRLVARAALDDCLSSRQIPVFAPGSTNYISATKPFNLRVTFKPAALAVPNTIQQVQDTVACGVANNVQVTAKSGGHSYASHGLGGEDGHLVIDLRRFNNVTANQTAHTAVVGAGGRLGNIATSLYNQGKQAMSHGTCPGVGVGGLTLHGGYGLISRMKGLALDNLLEATVVLANSTVVTASDTQNTDLFWALRGAGAAFGIVTQFKFKTFTAPENNIAFQYNLSPANPAQLALALDILQNFTLYTQPPELNMRLFVPGQFTGVYYGSRTDFDRIMNPLLTKLNATSGGWGNFVNTNSWLNTLTQFSNGPLAQGDEPSHENFYAKSLMPEHLSNAALSALAQYYFSTARQNTRSWYLLIDMHGGNNSAISNVSVDATAYAHRKAVFKMQFYDRVNPDSTAYDPKWFSFLNGWVQAIQDASPGVNFGMYINYADTGLTKDDAHKHYWGAHYDRLVEIKGRYDPKKVFEGPQLVGS